MTALEQKIWEKALGFLKIRAHSSHELKLKLLARFKEETASIETVIHEMERVELLNDRRFTEQYLNALIQKPIGRIKIMVETRKRGLNAELVEQMLLNLEWDEEASARRALEGKDARTKELDPRKRKQKLIYFLRSRGFKESTIYKILK